MYKHIGIIVSFVLAAVLSLYGVVSAGTEWVAGVGNWHTPSNWSSGVPNEANAAYIDNLGTALITSEIEQAVCAGVDLGDDPGSRGHIYKSSTNLFYIYNDLSVAIGSDSTCIVTLTAGHCIVGVIQGGGNAYVGCLGNGTVTNSGCYNQVFGRTEQGTPVGLVIGVEGTGLYELTGSGAQLNVNQNITLADDVNSSGKLDVQAGTLKVDYNLFVGGSGTAEVVIDDAEVIVGMTLAVPGGLGSGTLELKNHTADISVGDKLILDEDATFKISDAQGATIKLTGSHGDFEIGEGASPGQQSGEGLYDLGLLTLQFKGEDDGEPVKSIEVAGWVDPEGITSDDFNADNFVIGKLIIGDDGAGATWGPVTVQTVDAADNQDDGAGNEVLYVKVLDLQAGTCYGGDADHNIYFLYSGNPRRLYPGDANLDGAVNVGDLGILNVNYGTTEGANWGMADFNGDRAVNIGDLGVLGRNYGRGPGLEDGGGEGKGLPEPADFDGDGDIDPDDYFYYLEQDSEDDG